MSAAEVRWIGVWHSARNLTAYAITSKASQYSRIATCTQELGHTAHNILHYTMTFSGGRRT